MNNNNPKKDPNKKKNMKNLLMSLLICLGITILFTSVMNRYKNGEQKEISYSKFVKMLDNGEVDNVTLTETKILIEPKEQKSPLVKTVYYTIITPDYKLVDRLLEANVTFK